MLFADDAALVAHTEEALQRMINSFSQASKDFGLTISLKKTNIMAQDTPIAPVIHIDNYNLSQPTTWKWSASSPTLGQLCPATCLSNQNWAGGY